MVLRTHTKWDLMLKTIYFHLQNLPIEDILFVNPLEMMLECLENALNLSQKYIAYSQILSFFFLGMVSHSLLNFNIMIKLLRIEIPNNQTSLYQ